MFKNTGTPVQLHDLMQLEPGYKPGMTWGDGVGNHLEHSTWAVSKPTRKS